MASELVKRLRATYPTSGLSANTQLLREKAADEIERLTAQLAEEQRISNLRGDTINKMLDQMAEADQQLAEARQAERAAVVAWLRGQVTCGCGRDDCIEDGYPLAYATAIEAGEHLA